MYVDSIHLVGHVFDAPNDVLSSDVLLERC